MQHFKNLEEEALQQFLESLKERWRANAALISEETIDKLGLEILDNLEAKNDLFSFFKLDEHSQDQLHQLEDRPSFSDEEDEKDNTERYLPEQQKEADSDHSPENWEKEYEKEMELADKIAGLSRKASNLHIAGVYDPKGHKCISPKDEHRFSVGPLVLKTEEEEYLVPQMQCTLARGVKHEIMCLSEDVLKREEMKDYSQDEKELLMGEMEEN